MVERSGELQLRAEELSSSLFDGLVWSALVRNRIVTVEYASADADEEDVNPIVLIDGKPVLEHARRVLQWCSVDPDVIEATGPLLEAQIASSWSDAVKAVEELCG